MISYINISQAHKAIEHSEELEYNYGLKVVLASSSNTNATVKEPHDGDDVMDGTNDSNVHNIPLRNEWVRPTRPLFPCFTTEHFPFIGTFILIL